MDEAIEIHSVETLKQEKIELEQEFFEVSTKLDETTTKYNEISEACEQLRRQVESLEAERTLKTKHIFNLEGSKDALQSRLAELERKCDFLSQDKTSLTGILENRGVQIQSLEDQIRLLQEQLKKEMIEKTINQQKLDDVALIEQSLQHKENLWTHERELFYEEKIQLKNQIMEREQQIQRSKRENALKILNLQKDVDFAENEKMQHKNDASKYKEENEKLKKQADELNCKLKEAADHLATIQADHEKEMFCQTKLVTLYKESSEEAEKKIEQLTSCLEDTQALFDEAKNAHFAMKEELANVEKEKEEILGEKDIIIAELKDELEKANELLRSKHRVQLSDEEIAALSPGAAAAGRLIKSGQSLTQIYREHLKLVEELDQQKLENKRLEQYFRELVQDIEEKAPILKQQQNEYYRTVDHLEQVKMQLTAQQDDYQRLLNEKDGNFRQLTFAKAELERFQRDNADLTSQVRELLQCIEKVRRGDYDAVTLNRFEQIGDSTLNAEDFYLYRNIDELQAQNQRLMSALRQADAKRDEMIKAAQDAELSKIKTDLTLAIEELDQLKDHRGKQEKLIQAVMEQRDTYQRLLKEKPAMNGDAEKVSEKAITYPSIGKDQGEIKAALDRLGAEFEVYREDRKRNETSMNETIDKLKSEMTDLRMTNVKLNAEIQYEQNRFKTLSNNVETYKKDIKSLRERNEKIAISVSKYEQSFNNLTQELSDSKEQIVQLRMENSALENQKGELQRKIDSLSQEVQSLTKLSSKYQIANDVVSGIQAQLERMEAEQILRLRSEIDSARQDRDRLQKALIQSEQSSQMSLKENMHKIANLEAKLTEQERKIKRTEEELAFTEEQVEKSKKQNEILKKDLDQARISNQDTTSDRYFRESQQIQGRLNQLELQNKQATEEIKNLREKLTRSEKINQDLRSMTQSLENGLSDSKKAIEVDRSHLQERVQQLEKQLEESSIARLALAADLDRLKSASDEKDAKYSADMNAYVEKLTQISKNLNDVTSELKQSEERCERFKTDYTKTNEDLIEMQTKYSDQLKRAESLETDVEHLNQKLSIAKSQISELDTNLKALMNDLKQQNDKLSRIDSIHEENLKQYKERCEILEARNESLSEEHQNLSNLLSMLEKSKFAEEGQTSSTLDIASLQDQSFQSLNKIIEAMRGERSAKAKKLTEVEQELFKYQQREKYLEAEIEKISVDLVAAQKESERLEKVTQEKNILAEKMKNFNCMRETNDTLTVEMNDAMRKIIELEENAVKLTNANNKLDYQIKEQSLTVVEQNSRINASEKQCQELKKQYNQLVQERAKFESEEIVKLRTQSAELSKELSQKSSSVDAMRAEVTTLKNRIELAMQEHGKLSSEKDQLQSEIASLKSKFENLRRVASKYRNTHLTKEQEAKESKEKVTRLEAEIANLKDAESKNESVGDKEQEINGLRDELQNVKSELKAAKDDKNSLQNENERLLEVHCRNSLLEKQFVKVQKELEELRKQHSAETAQREMKAPNVAKSTLAVPAMPAASIGERPGPSNRRSVHVNPISRGTTKTMAAVHPTSAAPTTMIPAAAPPSTVVVDPLPQPTAHFTATTTTLVQPQNVVSTSTPSSVAILQQSAVPLAFVTPNQETVAPTEEYEESALAENQMQTISSSSISAGYTAASALPPPPLQQQNFAFSTNVIGQQQQQRDDDQPSTSTSAKRRQSFVGESIDVKRRRPEGGNSPPSFVSTSGQCASSNVVLNAESATVDIDESLPLADEEDDGNVVDDDSVIEEEQREDDGDVVEDDDEEDIQNLEEQVGRDEYFMEDMLQAGDGQGQEASSSYAQEDDDNEVMIMGESRIVPSDSQRAYFGGSILDEKQHFEQSPLGDVVVETLETEFVDEPAAPAAADDDDNSAVEPNVVAVVASSTATAAAVAALVQTATSVVSSPFLSLLNEQVDVGDVVAQSSSAADVNVVSEDLGNEAREAQAAADQEDISKIGEDSNQPSTSTETVERRKIIRLKKGGKTMASGDDSLTSTSKNRMRAMRFGLQNPKKN